MRISYGFVTLNERSMEVLQVGDWRELFKPWIVERGRDYFSNGHVVELEEEGFLVCAKVSGSQEYQVKIRSDSDGVLRMACDCPYAERGENCKHMAAVLFALEDVPEPERTDWQTALEQLPVEKLRELLRDLAVGDHALQARIVRMVSGPGNEPERWRKDMEQILLKHSDYRGDIVYSHEYHCLADLAQYLEDSLPYLLIDGQVMEGRPPAADRQGAVYALRRDAGRDAFPQPADGKPRVFPRDGVVPPRNFGQNALCPQHHRTLRQDPLACTPGGMQGLLHQTGAV